jgi:transcriptional regulator with XRE-family HTH domain
MLDDKRYVKKKELTEEPGQIYKLGERLRYLRESRHWTQEQFAKHAEVSQSTIAHIEKGLKDPSVGTLRKIAVALDIDIATIFASRDVHVFDIPRLRRKYKTADDLTESLYTALGKVIQYAKDISFLK